MLQRTSINKVSTNMSGKYIQICDVHLQKCQSFWYIWKTRLVYKGWWKGVHVSQQCKGDLACLLLIQEWNLVPLGVRLKPPNSTKSEACGFSKRGASTFINKDPKFYKNTWYFNLRRPNYRSIRELVFLIVVLWKGCILFPKQGPRLYIQYTVF